MKTLHTLLNDADCIKLGTLLIIVLGAALAYSMR